MTIDLPERVTGNMVDDLEVLRNFVVCKPLHRKVEDFVGLDTLRVLRQLHYRRHPLAKHGIRHTDNRSIAHRRMGHQDTLDLDRRDIRSPTNDQVFLTGNEPEITVAILSHKVACVIPACLPCIDYLARTAPIADRNMGTAYKQFACLSSRHRQVVVVNQANLCAWCDPAYRA